jgi:hypothetical protein
MLFRDDFDSILQHIEQLEASYKEPQERYLRAVVLLGHPGTGSCHFFYLQDGCCALTITLREINFSALCRTSKDFTGEENNFPGGRG